MARVIAFLLLTCLVATPASASWFSSFLHDTLGIPETQADVTVSPTYDPDTGDIGFDITVEWRFKRSADHQPTKVGAFSAMDADGDGFLTVEEWHAEKGGVINFAKFLQDMDKDGDEQISLDEFQAVKHVGVYTKN